MVSKRRPAGGGDFFGGSSSESAVDLMEASFFRSFAAVNGARYARRLRRSKTIDGGKTSEGPASVRPTARCDGGERTPTEEIRHGLLERKSGEFASRHRIAAVSTY